MRRDAVTAAALVVLGTIGVPVRRMRRMTSPDRPRSKGPRSPSRRPRRWPSRKPVDRGHGGGQAMRRGRRSARQRRGGIPPFVSAVRRHVTRSRTPCFRSMASIRPASLRSTRRSTAAPSRLSYTLFDGWTRPARVRQARPRLSAARESLHGAEQSFSARVLSTYLDVLSRAQVLDAQDRRVEALEAERARVERLLDVGKAARLAICSASIRLSPRRAPIACGSPSHSTRGA